MSSEKPFATRFGDMPNETGAAINWGLTRRNFIAAVGLLAGHWALEGTTVVGATAPAIPSGIVTVPVEFHLNGRDCEMMLDPRVTLLDALRETLQLTGTKKGCDHGQCGACTVLVNGRRINSCLSLAVTHQGDEIITIEGLAQGDELHPMQAAFVECDGFQCGYCTPGQICSAVAMLAEAQRGEASAATSDVRRLVPVELSPEEIRERMSGNICRCGAYQGIVEAVQNAHGHEAISTVERRNLP